MCRSAPSPELPDSRAPPCGPEGARCPKGTTLSSTTFSTLGVPAPIVAALAADGKTEAFPIQVDTLPDTLAGRDVLGRGKTGSGKTLAFSIPLVARLSGELAGGTRRQDRKSVV